MNERAFPTLESEIVLHLTPFGASTVMARPSEEVMDHRIRPTIMTHVNTTGREILLRCTGEWQSEEIGDQLLHASGQGWAANEFQRLVRSFIDQAAEYGILSLRNTAEKRAIAVTGSIDFAVPMHVSVELTTNCNLKCIYCYRDSSPGLTQHMSGNELLGILRELSGLGVRSVELTGGEPLLHPDFKEILSYCLSRFSRVALLSNGTLIDSSVADMLASHKEVALVQIDLDGPTAEIHEAHRAVKGSFRRAQNAIRMLSNRGLALRVAMNVTKTNLREIERTASLAKGLGARWFIYAPILDFGRGRDVDMVFSPEEMQYYADLGPRLRDVLGDFLVYADSRTLQDILQRERNCGAGHRTMVLGPTGRLRPCPMFPDTAQAIGDLSLQSISEALSNPIVGFFFNLIPPSPVSCGNCDKTYYCRHCLTRGFVTWSSERPDCSWAQATGLRGILQPLGSAGSETCAGPRECSL